MKIRFLFTLVLSIFFTISCNKVETKTAKELLSNKLWHVVQVATDINNNEILDDSDLFSHDSTLSVQVKFNDNGSGLLNFSNSDTTGSIGLNWTLDASNTYITSSLSSTIPSFNNTIVSKILTIDDDDLSIILDTSAVVKVFVFFKW